MASLSKAGPSAAATVAAVAESPGAGGVCTEAPRWNERLRPRKRSQDASVALRQQSRKRCRDASLPAAAPVEYDEGVEIGSVHDAKAEFITANLSHLTEEEMLPYYYRLYKKRANMGLSWYHEKNQEDHYEFTSVLLRDVYNFMDGGVCFMHMNFRARNKTTRSEKLFFAELALTNYVFDPCGGYVTNTCSVVNDDCLGGMRYLLNYGLPSDQERYDQQHCYVCSKKIKHPKGESYKGGHYAEDYGVDTDGNE